MVRSVGIRPKAGRSWGETHQRNGLHSTDPAWPSLIQPAGMFYSPVYYVGPSQLPWSTHERSDSWTAAVTYS